MSKLRKRSVLIGAILVPILAVELSGEVEFLVGVIPIVVISIKFWNKEEGCVEKSDHL